MGYLGLWKHKGLASSEEWFNWIHLPWLKGTTFGNMSWFYTQNCWASKATNPALAGTEWALLLWRPASALHQSLHPHTTWLLPEAESKQSNTQGTSVMPIWQGRDLKRVLLTGKQHRTVQENQSFPFSHREQLYIKVLHSSPKNPIENSRA